VYFIDFIWYLIDILITFILANNISKNNFVSYCFSMKSVDVMKRIFRISLFISTVLLAISCSSDSNEVSEEEKPSEELITDYSYNDSEIEVMQLINKHRENLGLSTLVKVNHISFKCEEHCNYMIANKKISHDKFIARSENIMSVMNAITVGENVAYNYKTSDAVMIAWLASKDHKKNIEGDYTHFGIAVKIDAENGRKYYTNIFAKIER